MVLSTSYWLCVLYVIQQFRANFPLLVKCGCISASFCSFPTSHMWEWEREREREGGGSTGISGVMCSTLLWHHGNPKCHFRNLVSHHSGAFTVEITSFFESTWHRAKKFETSRQAGAFNSIFFVDNLGIHLLQLQDDIYHMTYITSLLFFWVSYSLLLKPGRWTGHGSAPSQR